MAAVPRAAKGGYRQQAWGDDRSGNVDGIHRHRLAALPEAPDIEDVGIDLIQ
jgi:hypothetical protein